jgi:hypothetical protein
MSFETPGLRYLNPINVSCVNKNTNSLPEGEAETKSTTGMWVSLNDTEFSTGNSFKIPDYP